MSWEKIIKREWKGLSETIRVGDYIEVSQLKGIMGHPGRKKSGVIDKITIALNDGDIDGSYSSAIEVESYDLRLDYQGSVHFGDTTAYFNEIEKIGRE